ncbi:MAG: 5-methyltetrahydropteroyltriglutamate--homocysteine methyltransferase [Chloroflexota bacterium]
MKPQLHLLPTELVGSYPQPDWLIDRDALNQAGVPRVPVPHIWRIPPEHLNQARDDATVVAITEQERAGLDVITDGEIRRESYSNVFSNALDGVDPERRGRVSGRAGGVGVPVPLFTGKARRSRPVQVADVAFLRARTSKPIKVTIPGPFTMSEQAETTYYADRRALAMDLALAVNEEMKDMFAAGADVVQLDEPWTERWPERSKQYAVGVINRALEGITGTTALHVCFGYARSVAEKPNTYRFLAELEDCAVQQVSIEAAQCQLDLSQLKLLPSKTVILGVIDLLDQTIETPALVAQRIQAALEHIPPERLVIAPDCGMKFLPRATAFGKLRAMVEGAAVVRRSLRIT